KVKVPITTIIMPRIFGKPLLKNKLATIITAVKAVYITVINDKSINCPIVNTRIKATINPFNNALNPYTPSHSHLLHTSQFLSQDKVIFHISMAMSLVLPYLQKRYQFVINSAFMHSIIIL